MNIGSGCPSCGAVVDSSYSFCADCGAVLQAGKPGAQPTERVALGSESVIAGDVLGARYDVQGNGVFISSDDQTRAVKTCSICGKHTTVLGGYTCPTCGQFVCADDYRVRNRSCARCAEESGNLQSLPYTLEGKVLQVITYYGWSLRFDIDKWERSQAVADRCEQTSLVKTARECFRQKDHQRGWELCRRAADAGNVWILEYVDEGRPYATITNQWFSAIDDDLDEAEIERRRALMDEKDRECKAFLRHLADHGNGRACWYTWRSWDDESQINLSASYLAQGMSLGDLKCAISLSENLADGWYAPPDQTAATAILVGLADARVLSPRGFNILAERVYQGLGCNPDPEKALSWLDVAASRHPNRESDETADASEALRKRIRETQVISESVASKWERTD